MQSDRFELLEPRRLLSAAVDNVSTFMPRLAGEDHVLEVVQDEFVIRYADIAAADDYLGWGGSEVSGDSRLYTRQALPSSRSATLTGTGIKSGTPSLVSTIARETATELVHAAGRDADVVWAVPMLRDQASGARLTPTGEALLQLELSIDPATFFNAAQREGLITGYRPLVGTPDTFIADLPAAGVGDALMMPADLAALPGVIWAEPNFYRKLMVDEAEPLGGSFAPKPGKLDYIEPPVTLAADPTLSALPTDPLFNAQWHLNNVGQTGTRFDADADVVEAWNLQTGTPNTVVSVFDDGFQYDHPDLDGTVWVNPGEGSTSDGIDNDGNGWVDDLIGWDFVGNDNNPYPGDVNSGHGTAVSGVIAAEANNGIGGVGAAYGVRIQGVRILGGPTGAAVDSALASSVYYSAGRTANGLGTWNSASVQNHSWGANSPQATVIQTAFDWQYTNGRGGKGIAALVSTGNSGSGYAPEQIQFIPAGTWQFAFQYAKDGNTSVGQDAAWVADVKFPNGTRERFDNPTMPAGWTWAGAPWNVVNDPANAYGTGRYEARSPDIGDDQFTALITPPISTSGGNLSFRVRTDSEAGFDFFELYATSDGGASWLGPFNQLSGDTFSERDRLTQGTIAWPSRYASAISIGASTDWDYRSDYSQWGPEIDVVAPSGGGDKGITTTDLVGSAGSNPSSDYRDDFGGTSSAAPLTTAVAALMLSKNPNLTAAQIRTTLRNSSDKIGNVPYSAGFNIYYGYGRVNAAAAVVATPTGGVAPTVTAASFNHAVNPNRVTVSFSADVGSSLTASDLVVQNTTTSAVIADGVKSLNYNAATRTATLTFPGVSGGQLADGNYRVTLAAGSVSSGGTPMASAYTMTFFVLRGDANRDRAVDVTDLGILASNFRQTGRTWAQGDFNYDGAVNVSDLGILAGNFRRTLPSSLASFGTTGNAAPGNGTNVFGRPITTPFSDRALTRSVRGELLSTEDSLI